MRDVDEGDAHLALDRAQLVLHLLAQLQVERAQRLVEQQHARAVDERARQRHALALAAGELAGAAALVAAEPHHARAPRRRGGGARPSATFLIRSPYSTFSPTVMCGNSA